MSSDLSILYGSYRAGGASGVALLDARRPFRFAEDHDTGKGRIEYDVIVYGTTYPAFKTACDTFELAFKTRYQALVVTFGSTDTITITPSTNTRGVNTKPFFIKVADPQHTDTGLSRRYTVTVLYDLVATIGSEAGFRVVKWSIAQNRAGVRALTITGEVTASGSNDAPTVYLSGYTAQATTIKALSAITADGWEAAPVQNTYNTMDANQKTLSFTLVYNELVWKQSASLLDDTQIADQVIAINVKLQGPGDSVIVSRPIEVTVLYSASILVNRSVADSAQTTIKTVWDAKVRPWIVACAIQHAGTPDYAVIEDHPRFENATRTLTATMRFIFLNSDILQCEIVAERVVRPNTLAEPAWNGDKLARVLYQGPSDLIVTRRERTLRRGLFISGGTNVSGGGAGLGNPLSDNSVSTADTGGFGISDDPPSFSFEDTDQSGLGFGAPPDSGRLVPLTITRRSSARPIIWGIEGEQLQVTEVTYESVVAFVKALGTPKPRTDPVAGRVR